MLCGDGSVIIPVDVTADMLFRYVPFIQRIFGWISHCISFVSQSTLSSFVFFNRYGCIRYVTCAIVSSFHKYQGTSIYTLVDMCVVYSQTTPQQLGVRCQFDDM